MVIRTSSPGHAVAERLLDFQYYWETKARPFEWKFTRQDLAGRVDRFLAGNKPI